jgi:hypothetical protein
MDTYQYWIIIKKGNGSGTPPKEHTTYESAKEEVVRLSEAHPGATWHIFQLVAVARPAMPQLDWKEDLIPIPKQEQE